MTNNYEKYMNNHDFYETEARLTTSKIKRMIFRFLAEDWKKKALKLKLSEVCR